jgi:hypothetical protein
LLPVLPALLSGATLSPGSDGGTLSLSKEPSMAGLPSGAPSPTFNHVPVVTRTRREFGSIPLACGEQLTVQASRRARECNGVQLLHGIDGEPDRMAHLLLQPATARMLARALIEAAAAVDQAQRQPMFTRAAGAQGGAA